MVAARRSAGPFPGSLTPSLVRWPAAGPGGLRRSRAGPTRVCWPLRGTGYHDSTSNPLDLAGPHPAPVAECAGRLPAVELLDDAGRPGPGLEHQPAVFARLPGAGVRSRPALPAPRQARPLRPGAEPLGA